MNYPFAIGPLLSDLKISLPCEAIIPFSFSTYNIVGMAVPGLRKEQHSPILEVRFIL